MPSRCHLKSSPSLTSHGSLKLLAACCCCKKSKSMAYLLPNLPSSLALQPKPQEMPSNFTPPSPTSVHSIKHTLLSPLPPPSRHTKLELPPLRGAEAREPPGKPDDRKHNFYVNLGLAVRTLRDDLPQIFTKDLNYDIYRDDITFIDPLNTFSGIDKYKLIFWALRFHGKLLFREIELQVLRIWQPSENSILIRWNLRGIPRVPWEAKGHFQGTSRFKLDRKGKIYEHKVDNLAFNFPRPLKPTASVLDLVAASPASPNPTFFLWEQLKVFPSSWVDLYRAVKETLDYHQGYDLLPKDAMLVSCS